MKRLFGFNTAWADPDIHQEVRLSRREAEKGCTKKIAYKRNKDRKTLLVMIPPGMKTGMKIRLRGMGREGYRRGDLYLHVKAKMS
jgi:DnaJ-class molecular chaperone